MLKKLSKHNQLGRNGEILARQFLVEKGHIIVTQNFRSGQKEIDLISTLGDLLIFTEIKTRSQYYFGFPEEAVTPTKQAHLKAAAEAYLEQHPQYLKIRFDVISILLQQNEAKEILHFEDAFY